MCGRYSLAVPDPSQVRARFPVGEAVEIRARYNVAPGDEVLAVTTDRDGAPRGELLRWGLVPPWSEEPRSGLKMINARSETLEQRPAYRRAFERFRCLIIADGFYEWAAAAERRPKQAFHITRRDQRLFAFAGLWSVWHRGEDDEIRSCTIITTAANSAVSPIHDRMPSILEPENEAVWLEHGTPLPVLHDILHGLSAAETSVRAVGPAVNDARCDVPECLTDAPPPDGAGQQALFT